MPGKLEPCRTGEAAALACAGDGESVTAGAGATGGGRLFVIFWMRERLSASNRPRKMEECVLNFIHCLIVFFFGRQIQRQLQSKAIRTVTLSVILRTNLPSEDFHFTLYRVSQQVSPNLFALALTCMRAHTFLGELAYKFSAAS